MIAGRSVGTIGRSLIGLVVVAAIFFLLFRSLAANWGDLRAEEIDIRPALLVVSLIPGLAAIVVMSLAWSRIVGSLSPDQQGNRQLPKVFLYSWVGRYIPGKVAYVLGRFYLGRSVGVSTPVLVVSMAYEGVLLAVAAFAFASLTLIPSLAVVSESVVPYLVLPVFAIGGAVALHPRVMHWGLRFAMRLLGREMVEEDWVLAPERMAQIIGLFLITFSLSGIGLYLLIISLTSYSPGYLPLAAGTYTLAGVIGMFAIFAPAGIGVREGFMVGLLQFTMPLEMAILVALATRAWSTVLDLLVVGGAFAFDYVSGDRILFAAFSGRQGVEAGSEPPGALNTEEDAP